jgi:NAD+ diphosphatase
MPSFFNLCPRCGSPRIAFRKGKEFLCPDCGFDLFHNVAVSAGIFLRLKGKLLFELRAKEPAKGKLCLPGGFADPGESLEDAVLRECREELGIKPSSLSYLASFPNTYEYAGIAYSTCDIYFTGDIGETELEASKPDPVEVSGVELLASDEVDPEDLAFPSLRLAFAAYLKETDSGT